MANSKINKKVNDSSKPEELKKRNTGSKKEKANVPKVSSNKSTDMKSDNKVVKKTTSKNSNIKGTKNSVDKKLKTTDVKNEKVSKDKVSKEKVSKEKVIKIKKEETVKKNTTSKRTEKKNKNDSGITKTIVNEIVDDKNFDTGAIKTVEDSQFISEVLENKVIRLNKKSNKDKKSSDEDFKFTLDILDILILVVITAIASVVFTGFVMNSQFKKTETYMETQILSDENVKEFIKLYQEIVSNYYEEVDADALMKAAIKGMVEHLQDAYSIYLDADNTDTITDILDNSYEGIGIVAQGNVIVGVYKNSPASDAGLKVYDEIVNINGTIIDENNYSDISVLLSTDTSNTIIVKREDKELTFNVSVAKVNIPTAGSTTIDYDCDDGEESCKHIGYIKLSSFSMLSYEDFQESLLEIEKEKIESLIIDLRSNTGGYLTAAYDIANLFVEKDKMIYSLENKGSVTDFKATKVDKKDYKIVVLVNNRTASASEVLAAALHDSYGAIIVGKTTYGKGTVQTLKQLNDDSIVKYTSAKWLRPNGECINGIGIVPDYEVDIEYDSSNIYDKQLDKAIELLSK